MTIRDKYLPRPKNTFLSPDGDGGDYSPENDIAQILEEHGEDPGVQEGDEPVTEEAQPTPAAPSVAQMNLEDAIALVRKSGLDVAPVSTVQPEQTQQAQGIYDIAKSLTVPPEIAAQGYDQEMMWRLSMATEMQQQQQQEQQQLAMAPMLSMQAAQNIATQLNVPGMANQLSTELSSVVGPMWYTLTNEPKGSAVLNLIIKGIMSESAGKQVANKAPTPSPEVPGRRAPVMNNPDAAVSARIDQMFGHLGISGADLLAEVNN